MEDSDMANYKYRGCKVIVHYKNQAIHSAHVDQYPYWAEIPEIGKQVPLQREWRRLQFVANGMIDEYLDKGAK